jgi:hypothetical protein
LLKFQVLTKASFMTFALLFFVFRIVILSCFLKLTIIDGWYLADRVHYFTANSLLVSLYIMQIYWFTKIVHILKKNFRLST